MLLDQKEMMKKEVASFEDYCKWAKQRTGIELDEADKPIICNAFVCGYMTALDDMLNTGKGLS